jgi:DNA replication protein DnaC
MQYGAVMAWEYGPTGLWLWGNSGTGKTRCAYLLLRKAKNRRRDIVVMRGNQFQTELVALTKPGAREDDDETFDDWILDIKWASILFFDDLTKLKFSERTEVEFWQVLEHRTSEQLPTIFTAECPPSELLKRMSKTNGPAIVRRIMEFSTPINFNFNV